MRRNKRRKGRGRVFGIIVVLVGLAAAGVWMFVGKGYLRLRQAQATPADATRVAAAAGPLVIPAGDDEDSHWEKPPATLDQLAGREEQVKPHADSSGAGEAGESPSRSDATAADEPLKPRTSGGSDVSEPDTPTDAEAEGTGAGSDTATQQPGALKPVAPPAGPPAHKPPSDTPAAEKPDEQLGTGNARIDAALKLLSEGKLVEARHELNAMLGRGLPQNEQSEIRRQLTRIADDSVFSRRTVVSDPLVDSYTVRSGDRLVNLSRDYKVPAEVLMYVNGIKDATKIRAEQKIKILRGPFHVKISKSQFRMDVYLQDLYVRSYRVGLGADQGTPEGVWKVKERLENPTYYPPASSDKKRIIPPDDPENPLGNHWIGLEGVSGDAVGHTGYGIHGTIEPESIGRAVSLGCVRMLNEDVEFLYKLLQPGESTVTVQP